MIKVLMDKNEALNALIDRLKNWTEDEEVIDLYKKMYENYIDCGCFNECEFDVMKIVDNDYINWCEVLYKDEEDFNKLLDVYREQGLGDCSCEHCGYSYIEAVNDEENPTMMLVSY